MQKLQVLNHFTVSNSMADEEEEKLLSLFQHLAFNDELIVVAMALKKIDIKNGFWESKANKCQCLNVLYPPLVFNNKLVFLYESLYAMAIEKFLYL